MLVIIVIILILLLSLLLFYFSWSISSGVYLRCVCHRREVSDAIALTYDDGVDATLTPALLDLLDEWGAKATFCIIGERAEQHPEIVKRIAAGGHTIVNHSMHHKSSFPLQSAEGIYNEIKRCDTVIEQIVGKKIKYFRPPYGVTNPMIASAVRRAEKKALGWSIRSYDTMGHSTQRVVDRVVRQIKGGDIVLLHDNRDGVIDITRELLKYINDRGFRALSIEQLLGE